MPKLNFANTGDACQVTKLFDEINQLKKKNQKKNPPFDKLFAS